MTSILKRKSKRLILFTQLLAIIFFFGHANAALLEQDVLFDDAKNFLSFQQQENPSKESIMKAARLVGVIAGVADSLDGSIFCIPVGISVELLTKIVAEELVYIQKNNPNHGELPGVSYIQIILQNLYQCDEQNGSK